MSASEHSVDERLTVGTLKVADEPVFATVWRKGGKAKAQSFVLTGMSTASLTSVVRGEQIVRELWVVQICDLDASGKVRKVRRTERYAGHLDATAFGMGGAANELQVAGYKQHRNLSQKVSAAELQAGMNERNSATEARLESRRVREDLKPRRDTFRRALAAIEAAQGTLPLKP